MFDIDDLNNGYCGECFHFMEENLEGDGICDRGHRFVKCYSDACNFFVCKNLYIGVIDF